MNRRFARAFLVGLLLLQTGLFAPAAMALDGGQPTSDCADHSDSGGNGDSCCPESVSTYEGCGAICPSMIAAVSYAADTVVYATAQVDPRLSASFLPSQTYTPVNPPPIG